jgi:hypothetical protein
MTDVVDVVDAVEPEVQAEPELSAEDVKKEKKLAQLKAARDAKAQRKAEKAEEDKRIREELAALKEEHRRLTEPPPPASPSPSPSPTPPPSPRRGPVKVTRDAEDAEEKPPQQEGRSFGQQAVVTGVVGALGLASWYCQNRMFNSPPPPPQTKKRSRPEEPPPPQPAPKKKTPQVHVQPTPSALSAGLRPAKRRTVGGTGFVM